MIDQFLERFCPVHALFFGEFRPDHRQIVNVVLTLTSWHIKNLMSRHQGKESGERRTEDGGRKPRKAEMQLNPGINANEREFQPR